MNPLDLHRAQTVWPVRAPRCKTAAFRSLVIPQHEPARQRARELANTPEFAKLQRKVRK